MLWKYAHINWNDYPTAFKRGQLVARVPELMEYYVKSIQGCRDPGKAEKVYLNEPVVRQTWQLIETPIFTQGSWLQDSIPTYKSVDGDDD
jgi:tRNA(His) 5'-end guanylyltransferase